MYGTGPAEKRGGSPAEAVACDDIAELSVLPPPQLDGQETGSDLQPGMPGAGARVPVQEAVSLQREELGPRAQHVMAANGVDSGDLKMSLQPSVRRMSSRDKGWRRKGR